MLLSSKFDKFLSSLEQPAETIEHVSLREMVQSTFPSEHRLDRFQHVICDRIEDAYLNKKWLLIHAPPGVGKSVIVAQRYIAWAMGLTPTVRTVLQCYNQRQAIKHGVVVVDTLESRQYQKMFPWVSIPGNVSNQAFATTARSATGDGQMSFAALGLGSGLTGNHPELLVMDDPYKDSEEAKSPVINDKIYSRVTGTVFPRLRPGQATFVVMFHRYAVDDLAGRMLDTGLFEYLRLPAICDDEATDPLGRKLGELLTPRLSMEWLERLKEEDPYTFYGQYQGTPIIEGAQLFRKEDFQAISVEELPPLAYWLRFWDLATSTKQGSDYTAGALVGVGEDGSIYIADMQRFRKEWPESRAKIEAQAQLDAMWLDSIRKTPNVARATLVTGVEDVQFQLAAIQDLQRHPTFERFPLMGLRPDKGKKERALVIAARARMGKLFMVRGPWNAAMVNEFTTFTGEDSSSVRKDDQVDAVAGAMALLAKIRGGTSLRVNELEPTLRAFL